MELKILDNVILKFFLSTLLFLIISLPLLTILVLFYIYRFLIYVNLRIKLGSKFWGLLNGLDVLFSMEGPSKNLICILMTVRVKNNIEDFLEKFKNQLRTKVLENPQQFSKLLATRHQAFGFYYLIKDQVKIDDCVRILKIETATEEIGKEEFLTKLDNCFGDPLPYDNTGFWEILICDKPLKGDKGDTEKSYLILARVHHALTDGQSLMQFFMETFADSDPVAKSQEPIQNGLVRLLMQFQDILIGTFYILMAPITILRHSPKPENNSLQSAVLGNENFLVANVEKSSECLKIIKDIKKKNTNTTFTYVLFSAISKSFSDYFQKKNKDPNLTSILASITIIIKKSNLSLTKYKSTQLLNNFAFHNINIPIIFREHGYSRSKNDQETLEAVKKEFQNVRNAYDYQIFFGFLKLTVSLFPIWIIPRILTPVDFTLFTTNLPGPSLTTAWNGCLIENIVFWPPVIGRTGLALSIFSYDKRLQIGLTVNKALMSQREDAQSIVDGIHRAIIEMDSNV